MKAGEKRRSPSSRFKPRVGMAKEGEEDGWSFWGRVYANPELRREIAAGAGNEPTLTQMLSGEALQRTRLILTNITRALTEPGLKSLLETELGSTSVLSVHFLRGPGHRAIVEFYYADQAAKARKFFHGRMIKGQRVAASEPGPRFKPMPTMAERGLDPGDLVRLKDEERTEPGLTFNDLVSIVSDWVREGCPIRIGDRRVTSLVKEQGSESLQRHMAAWPQGAFRMRKEFRLVGPFLCLPNSHSVDVATVLCSTLGAKEGDCSKEPWEPFPLDNLRTLLHTVEYLGSLLAKFGPLWLWDPRITAVLLHWDNVYALPRSTFVAVAADAGIGLYGDTFYNLRLQPHREALRDVCLPAARLAALTAIPDDDKPSLRVALPTLSIVPAPPPNFA